MSLVARSRFKAESGSLSRRTFLTASLAAGGGLLLTLKLPISAWGAASGAGPVDLNAFVRIDRDGTVRLIMPYVEMGQGTYTSISMLIAEELDLNSK
jgi:isoquinoline 1-oxidoreductase subunit beta